MIRDWTGRTDSNSSSCSVRQEREEPPRGRPCVRSPTHAWRNGRPKAAVHKVRAGGTRSRDPEVPWPTVRLGLIAARQVVIVAEAGIQ